MARKKHSARKGNRAMKRDVAPLSAIRRDEIVEEVIDNLRPWKNHRSRDTVTPKVKHSIDALRKIVPIQKELYDRKPFREFAKKFDKVVTGIKLGKVQSFAISYNVVDRTFFHARYVKQFIWRVHP